MAGRVYTSVAYAVVRLAIWLLLFIGAVIDGLRHRQIRSRGWQLYLLLVVSTALFVSLNPQFIPTSNLLYPK